jgi:PAS domain S-box-containing protein
MGDTLLAEVVDTLRRTVAAASAHDASQVLTHLRIHEEIAEVPAIVLIADQHGQIIAASRRALQLLEHTRRSIRALNVTELAAAEDAPHGEQLWEAFLRERRQSGRFALRRRRGGTIRTEYTAAANVVAGLSVAVHWPVTDDEDPPH